MAVSIASDKTQRFFRWTEWKSMYLIKGLPLQWEDDGVIYTIWTYDSQEVLLCQIYKAEVSESATSVYSQEQNDLDKTDFESNFKSLGNLPLSQIDIDGAQIVRIKAAKKGWTYFACPIEFKTSTINSLYSKLYDGTNRPGITLKFYDSSNVEVTEPGIMDVNESLIVKTVIDFEPPYDYEVIGGELRINQDITSLQDCRLYIIAVPDISAEMGGSKEMVGGINLKYLAPQNMLLVDGRVSKTLIYNATYHTNKLRFVLIHDAGLKIDFHITLDLFRK